MIRSNALKAATDTGVRSVVAIARVALLASRGALPIKKIATTAFVGSFGFATALSGLSQAQAQSPRQPVKNSFSFTAHLQTVPAGPRSFQFFKPAAFMLSPFKTR